MPAFRPHQGGDDLVQQAAQNLETRLDSPYRRRGMDALAHTPEVRSRYHLPPFHFHRSFHQERPKKA
jgi:hypothetical protein